MKVHGITQSLLLLLTAVLLLVGGCASEKPERQESAPPEPNAKQTNTDRQDSASIPELVAGKIPLSILYVGMKGSERFDGFSDLLTTYFQTVQTADLNAFKEEDAADADVVIFDKDGLEWNPQKPLPISISADWSKPTVSVGVPGAFWCSRRNLKLGYM